MVRIESILTATTEDIVKFYDANKPNQYTKEEFLQQYQRKQKTAQADEITLRSLGVTYQQASDRVHYLASATNRAYSNCDLSTGHSLTTKVNIDETFEVSVLKKSRIEECGFCEVKLKGPATYQITNLTTHEKIDLLEINVHLLLHSYCGLEGGPCRLDPTRMCRVLGIVNQTEVH